MANITGIGQLAVTATTVASSLTQTMSVSQFGTQPVPPAGPSALNNMQVAASTLFSATLGGSTTNTDVLGAISQGLTGITSLSQPGLISNVTTASGAIGQAASLLSDSGLSGVGNYSSAFSSDGLAGIANAAFGVGATDFGIPGLGGGGLPGSTEGATGDEVPKDWIFITAPQSVSWDKQGEMSIVNTYGSNSPYVIYSSTGMRKLSLGECLVEGFSAGKEVEDHVLKLEKLMTMVMNTEKGYVSPYVWDLRAGDKSYGKFIIESVQIKEDMRNAKGRADRATASISLQQVPDFQINDGRDLATKADLASGQSLVSEGAATETKTADAKAKTAGDKVKAKTSGAAAGAAGATGGAKDASPAPITGRASGGGQFQGPSS